MHKLGRKSANRQYEMLEAIREHISVNGYPPTMRYLMAKMELKSLSTVDYYLRILVREGLIQRERNLSRSITITGDVPEESGQPSAVTKLDGRRMSSLRSVEKRREAGKPQPKGTLMIHGQIESKRDPDLQKRIDMVVEKALSAQQSGHCTDVINGYHTLKFHSSGLKVHQVG